MAKKKNYTLRLNPEVIKKAAIRAIMENTKVSSVVEAHLIKYGTGIHLENKKAK